MVFIVVLTEIFKVTDAQPYLKHFAYNWPIIEHIKCHHKWQHAYWRRLADDETNVTSPDIDISSEFGQ